VLIVAGLLGTLGWVAAGAIALVGTATAIAARPDTIAGGRPSLAALAQCVLAIGLAGAGAGFAIGGADLVGEQVGRDLGRMADALLIGPMLALPMIGWASGLATTGRRQEAVAATAWGASVTAGLVLPGVILFAGGLSYLGVAGFPLEMDLQSWRLDAVMLLLGGLFLLPCAVRRWPAGKLEGTVLIGIYIAYLVVTLLTSV
jgi:hypothetical protein